MLHFPFMCRLCLVPCQTNPTLNIFESKEIAIKILELANVKVMNDDGLPQEICVLCHQQLELSVTFKRQVIRANSMLHEHVATQGSRCSSPDLPLITGDPLSEEGVGKTVSDCDIEVKELAKKVEVECVKNAADEVKDVNPEKEIEGSDDDINDPFNDGEPSEVEPSAGETDSKVCDLKESESQHRNITIKEEVIDCVIAQPWPVNMCSPHNSEADLDVKPCIESNNHEVKERLKDININITNIKREDVQLDTFECSEEDTNDDTFQIQLDLECTDVIDCSCQFCKQNQPNKAQHEKCTKQELFKCNICEKSFPSRNGLHGHQRHHPPLKKSRLKKKKSRYSVSEQSELERHITKDIVSDKQVQENQPNDQDPVLSPQKTLQKVPEGNIETRAQKAASQDKLTLQNQKPQVQNKNNLPQDPKSQSCVQETLPNLDQQSTTDVGGGTRRSSRTIKAPVRHVVPHYSCSKCERMYSDQAALENHEKTHSRLSFKCNHCGKKFYEKDLLERHIHMHIGQTRTRNLGHQCNICNKYFETRPNLFSHMKSHKRTIHLCEICGKTVSLAAYPAHKRIHLNANSHEIFKCDLCEKKFNNKMSLRTHKNSYHGTLKFTCEVCGKQFTTMALMKHHQNIHSGKRDHVCHICNRAFSLKVTLKSHMRIHTGEMPYGCDSCGRYFTWKTTYRNHVATCKGNNLNPGSNAINNISVNVKPIVSIPLLNVQQAVQCVPQELPIDYSEEQKYDVPIDYSDESRYKNVGSIDTKYFPTIINLSENEMKYSMQHTLTYPIDIKPCSKDLKLPN